MAEWNVRLCDDLLAQFDLPEAVLLHAQTGHYFAANPVASVILRGIHDGWSRGAIVDDIVRRFEVDRATAGADADRLVALAVQLGLLVNVAA